MSPLFMCHVALVSGVADRLAGVATIDDDWPMGLADIVNVLRELGRGEDREMTSPPRMHELRVNNGMVRNKRFSRQMRGIVSQH